MCLHTRILGELGRTTPGQFNSPTRTKRNKQGAEARERAASCQWGLSWCFGSLRRWDQGSGHRVFALPWGSLCGDAMFVWSGRLGWIGSMARRRWLEAAVGSGTAL